ncbi:MAG: RsmD family RNA methyltransferase [Chitinivibrionales bacterium]
MKLRIIAGDLKGRIITLPEKSVRFRPTQGRVRQALAEILKKQIPGAIVADLCAGSGAFGFECLSRGAREAHFVEHDRILARRISEFIKRFGLEKRAMVHVQDVRHFSMTCKSSFDIIFYDPPYAENELAGLLPQILELLSPQGTLLHERAAGKKGAETAQTAFDSTRYFHETRNYGDTGTDFYTRRNA